MAAAALLSRILGWLRDWAIGNFWGTTGHTDTFWEAFGVPDLLYYMLAGGALGAALIPVFSGYLVRKEEQESWRIANSLITLFGSCAALGILVIIAFAPHLVLLVAPGFAAKRGPAVVMECASYVRLLAPMVFFTVLSALFTAILQSHRHFTAPAMAWLVYNFGIIGGAFVGGGWVSRRYHSDMLGMMVLCVGVVVGAVLLVAVQVPPLLARGFRYRPSLAWRHPGVREVMRLFVPYVIGLAFPQICLLWLPNFFGSYFQEGAVSSLRYANRLVVLPLGLFGIAISTAAFPVMAERIAAGEIAEFRKLFSGTLRAVFFLAVPSSAAIFVLAGPILRLLWRSQKLGESGIAMAEFSLLYFAASLIGLSGLQILNRAFYSLKDARTPPLVSFAWAGVTALGGVLLLLVHSPLQYAGSAAAMSLGSTLGMVAMFELLRRRMGGIDGRAITVSFVRIAIASAVAAAVAYWVSAWLGPRLGVPVTHFATTAPEVVGMPLAHGSKMAVILQVLVSLGTGAAVYLATLRLLRAPELDSVGLAIRNRRSSAVQTAPVG
jgi:putative peptidoglycan lipid II flippase